MCPDASCSRSEVSLLGLTNHRSVADGQQYEYGEDLGVTAVALYDYQAGETERCGVGLETEETVWVTSAFI